MSTSLKTLSGLTSDPDKQGTATGTLETGTTGRTGEQGMAETE